MVPWRAAATVAVLGVLVGFGLLFVVFAIFSIGLLVLPLSLVLLVVLARAIRGGRSAGAAGGSRRCGARLRAGVPLACLDHPADRGVLRERRGEHVEPALDRTGGFTTSSSGISTADGVQTGRLESPNSIATYRCEQGRIVGFHREAR